MSFTLDLRPLEPIIKRVELLQHPQIPGPLGGVNPRSVLGDTWWDSVRQRAYRLNNYHCHACAGSPDDDPIYQTLDAHECYDINWIRATATYAETVALCRSCHSFIHAGRSAHVLPSDQLRYVLKRGMDLLDRAHLHPYWRTYVIVQEVLYGKMSSTAVREARRMGLVISGDALGPPSSWWVMRVNGQDYRRNAVNGKVELVT